MQVPRNTYLPLLLSEIRENFVELALDESQVSEIDTKNWWFEQDTESSPCAFAPQGPCGWYVPHLEDANLRHHPLDLIATLSQISNPFPPSSSSSRPEQRTLNLILHLKSPPAELLLTNSVDSCRNQFVNQVKEADFVRWRNTSRVTGLRKGETEAGWEGIVGGE
jgi:autophagy-related protein 5